MIAGRRLPLLLCLLPLLTQSPQAMAKKPVNSWHLLAGFGESHPSWGKTQQRVKTRDLILRHQRPQERVRGEGWYLNRRSTLIEIPLHWL
ncbi:MAG: acyloxyacyl hydrolase, partial [Candidatus Thiodiazotropha sp. (ex Dulcina madagascariensis)]|nr:acyloxyacyl hydrolase [Candidatus Thiodiazotropha sp. (ex Dulcina madagascariensis)]